MSCLMAILEENMRLMEQPPAVEKRLARSPRAGLYFQIGGVVAIVWETAGEKEILI